MYSLSLRKVKNVDNAYKIYDGRARPIMTVPKTVFIDSDQVRLDNETVKKILALEKELQSVINGGSTIVGSIKTVLSNDKPVLVLPVDTKGLKYNIKNTCYTINVVCRSIKYIEEDMVIVSWMVENIVEEESFSSDTEEEIEDDIEAPTEDLLNLRNECIERVAFLFERLQQIKDDIETLPLNNIPKIVEDIEKFYNEEHEK